VIVVGGGTAGSVLAGVLGADPRFDVVVLEAGPDGDPPGVLSDSFFDALAEPGRTYRDVMVERTRGAAPTQYVQGRGIGGSSAINGMVATTGSKAEVERWATEFGCEGWTYDDLRGSMGLISLMTFPVRPQQLGPVDRALVRAAKAMGHQHVKRPWIISGDGVGPADLMRFLDVRRHAANVFLDPQREHENVTVRADTTVTRILLDGRRAVGVELADGGTVEGREIVIAAGALASPLLLLRSGVQHPGIGQGLKDHPSVTFTLRLRTPADPSSLAAGALLKWSSPGATSDLQALALNHVGVPEYGALIGGLMRVHSSGTVELVDGRASIRFNMLDDERDIDRLRAAAKHLAQLAESKPFASVAKGVFIDDHGSRFADLGSDADIDAWIRGNVGAYTHAGCTCRMGPASDPSAVVDTHLRVNGYEGLRVCDASVFPDLPSANPMCAAILVGHHLAQRILAA
jgi:choline dehydrogenase/5-(hydroxymethyl)furfural/furfural oxidase